MVSGTVVVSFHREVEQKTAIYLTPDLPDANTVLLFYFYPHLFYAIISLL